MQPFETTDKRLNEDRKETGQEERDPKRACEVEEGNRQRDHYDPQQGCDSAEESIARAIVRSVVHYSVVASQNCGLGS
jgi:hypothetical protein